MDNVKNLFSYIDNYNISLALPVLDENNNINELEKELIKKKDKNELNNEDNMNYNTHKKEKKQKNKIEDNNQDEQDNQNCNEQNMETIL